MAAPAGWYHVEGDPPGTVRRWNGSEWIGFAVPDPSLPDDPAHQAAPRQAHVGQQRLGPAAVFCCVALVWLAASSIAGLTAGDEPPEFVRLLVATGVPSFMLAAGSFAFWFFRAYRNVSLWAATRRSPIWAALSWFIPLVNLYLPFSIMLELFEQSPGPSRRGALNPLIVLLWWVLSVAPPVLAPVVSYALTQRRHTSVEQARETLDRTGDVLDIALWMLCVPLLIAPVLVYLVTREQDMRLVS